MTAAQWPWVAHAQQTPHKTALRCADSSLTWAELTALADARAAGFYQQGVRESNCVVLRGKNSTELVIDFLALLRCGAVILTLNPALPRGLQAELVASLDADYLCDRSDGTIALPLKTLDPSVTGTAPPDVIPHPKRLATLILTSGSTGLPKAIAHRPVAHLAAAQGVVSLLNYQAGDSWLLSLPLCHVSGQGILWRWLLQGGEMVLRAEGETLAESLRGCTHASLVPTQLWRLLQSPETLPPLQDVLLGGAAIPVALTEAAEARGIRCWCGYGMTEFASTVCAKRADGKPGVGYPLSGKDIRLDEQQQILVNGDSFAAGVWLNGALHTLPTHDGWYPTRDKGHMQDGELVIDGRLDNLFCCGGENVQPEVTEKQLMHYPLITECLVVPVNSDEFGAVPVYLIRDYDDWTDEQRQHFSDWCLAELPAFMRPAACYALPEADAGSGIKRTRAPLIRMAQDRFHTR
ncbi:TPA: o-succinylbenzoate--CoA ligase [Morganella morganii]|nr:o-succinylbenzoate--CoA ligase [Morganella morganii]